MNGHVAPGQRGATRAMDAPPPPHPADGAGDEQWLGQKALEELQRHKLSAMLAAVRSGNAFYRNRLDALPTDISAPLPELLRSIPLTTRRDLEQDQLDHPPYGTNLTYPLDQYCRFHQTSGTGGRPMRWLDTPQSWDWFKHCWRIIYGAAGVKRGDRVVFAFSFGPFVGFWAAFDGAAALGALSIPAGGLSTSARLKLILDNHATAVCCTPTYALRMSEVAAEEKVDLSRSGVRAIIVAGEAGGSVPEVRARIESAWGGNARVYDHHGMTEIGPVSFECEAVRGGLHVIESEFIAEVIDPQTLQPLPEGGAGELVLTNLGRWGSPLIRYRTGDRVKLVRGRCACGRWYARLDGGILGRFDDMFIVRGNNVFPNAVEAVIRRIPDVAEFRLTVLEGGPLTQVRLEVEPGAATTGPSGDLANRVAKAVQEALSFRAEVVQVPPGTLPRFELKAKRFVRRRVDQ